MELADRPTRLYASLVDGGSFTLLFLLAKLPIVGFVAWLVMLVLVGAQWYLLTTKGQTLGKLMFKIKIVKRDSGENGGFVTNVLLRSIVNGILTMIPLYFLADALFIFRENNLCVHDYIAGTQVVKA